MWFQKEYNDRLISCRLDHEQFDDMQQDLSGETMVDNLVGDFEILFYFKSTCAELDDYSYVENVELRVVEKEMTILDFPTVDQWKIIEHFRKNKFRLY